MSILFFRKKPEIVKPMSISNNDLLNLNDKTAIVTGGAVGIGLGITARLAEAGASVMIADLSEEDSNKTVSDLTSKGYKVKACKTDVSSETDVKNLVEQTVKEFGSIDILVNNAGIYPNILVSKMLFSDFDKILAVNLEGVFLTTKYCSEQMIAQGKGGKIINITSIDAIHPSMMGLAAYDASKHGLWGFTKNSAIELAQHQIWVNAIAPGGINTPGVAKATAGAGKIDPKMMEAFMAKIPMHKMGDPDDIGKVALFLASDMSSYMTGSQVVVDGGALLS
ncbi:MAG: SDR family NAD(P)-dependent oxidoreductase [Candidatus Daviesbacteria bacterium]|nr:SDR family NAD(P)-dependent oxidoreductase [Candidatus Daviesbacteria bacterium]